MLSGSLNVNTQRKHEGKRDLSSLAVDHLVAEDRVNVWSVFHIPNQPGSCLNPGFSPWVTSPVGGILCSSGVTSSREN